MSAGTETSNSSGTQISTSHSRLKVLYLEDSPTQGKEMTIRAASHGITVTAVTKVADAIDRLRGAEYDILLCDVLLDDVTAHEFIGDLLQHHNGRVACLTYLDRSSSVPGIEWIPKGDFDRLMAWIAQDEKTDCT